MAFGRAVHVVSLDDSSAQTAEGVSKFIRSLLIQVLDASDKKPLEISVSDYSKYHRIIHNLKLCVDYAIFIKCCERTAGFSFSARYISTRIMSFKIIRDVGLIMDDSVDDVAIDLALATFDVTLQPALMAMLMNWAPNMNIACNLAEVYVKRLVDLPDVQTAAIQKRAPVPSSQRLPSALILRRGVDPEDNILIDRLLSTVASSLLKPSSYSSGTTSEEGHHHPGISFTEIDGKPAHMVSVLSHASEYPAWLLSSLASFSSVLPLLYLSSGNSMTENSFLSSNFDWNPKSRSPSGSASLSFWNRSFHASSQSGDDIRSSFDVPPSGPVGSPGAAFEAADDSLSSYSSVGSLSSVYSPFTKSDLLSPGTHPWSSQSVSVVVKYCLCLLYQGQRTPKTKIDRDCQVAAIAEALRILETVATGGSNKVLHTVSTELQRLFKICCDQYRYWYPVTHALTSFALTHQMSMLVDTGEFVHACLVDIPQHLYKVQNHCCSLLHLVQRHRYLLYKVQTHPTGIFSLLAWHPRSLLPEFKVIIPRLVTRDLLPRLLLHLIDLPIISALMQIGVKRDLDSMLSCSLFSTPVNWDKVEAVISRTELYRDHPRVIQACRSALVLLEVLKDLLIAPFFPLSSEIISLVLEKSTRLFRQAFFSQGCLAFFSTVVERAFLYHRGIADSCVPQICLLVDRLTRSGPKHEKAFICTSFLGCCVGQSSRAKSSEFELLFNCVAKQLERSGESTSASLDAETLECLLTAMFHIASKQAVLRGVFIRIADGLVSQQFSSINIVMSHQELRVLLRKVESLTKAITSVNPAESCLSLFQLNQDVPQRNPNSSLPDIIQSLRQFTL